MTLPTVVEGHSEINSYTDDRFAIRGVPMVVELVGETNASGNSTRETSLEELPNYTS